MTVSALIVVGSQRDCPEPLLNLYFPSYISVRIDPTISARISSMDYTRMLHESCCGGPFHPDEWVRNIQFYIDNGAAMDSEFGVNNGRAMHYHVLHEACSNPNVPLAVIECLVTNGADVNYINYSETALRIACERVPQSIEIMKYLIANGANVNDGTLHRACAIGSPIELVKLLVENGADVNLVFCYTDGTPLNHACTCTDTSRTLDMIKFLVSKNASLTVLDNADRTYLQLVCMFAGEFTPRILEFLIESGLDVHHESSDGYTVLHYAAALQSTYAIQKEMIHILLKHTRSRWLSRGSGRRPSEIDWILSSLQWSQKDSSVSLFKFPVFVDAYLEWLDSKMLMTCMLNRRAGMIPRLPVDLIATICEYIPVVVI